MVQRCVKKNPDFGELVGRRLKQLVLFATGLGVGLETNPKLLTTILFSKSKLPAVAAAL